MGTDMGSTPATRRAEGRFDLTGKVALVTGGNSGIGLSMAEGLLAAGAAVAIWGRTPEKNAAALEQLSATGGRVVARSVDVGDEDQVVAGMAALVDELGRLDACFANAAAHGSSPGSFTAATLEGWRAVTGVVLDGVFLTTREAAKVMVAQGDGGSLVATSSIAANFGLPRGGQAYSAAKAGVIALMRGLAVELGRHRIRANTIVPGWVMSSFMDGIADNPRAAERILPRVPLRRWGEPDELAGAAVYLASDASTWHTGDELRLDGGYSMF